MKAITKIYYPKIIFPTARCNKPRTRDVYADYEYEIRETTKDEAPVVVIVHDVFEPRTDYSDKEIRLFDGKLYERQLRMHFGVFEEDNEKALTPATIKDVKDHIDCGAEINYEGFSYDEYAAKVRGQASEFLLIEDEVWKVCGVPMYYIYAPDSSPFNSTITYVSIAFSDNNSLLRKRCFSAFEREKALSEAIRIAEERGDLESAEQIKNEECNIIVLNPSVIRPIVRSSGGNCSSFAGFGSAFNLKS